MLTGEIVCMTPKMQSVVHMLKILWLIDYHVPLKLKKWSELPILRTDPYLIESLNLVEKYPHQLRSPQENTQHMKYVATTKQF